MYELYRLSCARWTWPPLKGPDHTEGGWTCLTVHCSPTIKRLLGGGTDMTGWWKKAYGEGWSTNGRIATRSRIWGRTGGFLDEHAKLKAKMKTKQSSQPRNPSPTCVSRVTWGQVLLIPDESHKGSHKGRSKGSNKGRSEGSHKDKGCDRRGSAIPWI